VTISHLFTLFFISDLCKKQVTLCNNYGADYPHLCIKQKQMKTFKIIALFVFLTLLGTSMTSCVVRLSENHGNRGQHRGWYKNKQHRSHKTYVIKKSNNKQPKQKSNGKGRKQNKNRWDAKK
jgi:hypothetical protein